jgi:transcription elongation GreA/GreB family factor
MAEKKMEDLAAELQLMSEAQDFVGTFKILEENRDVLTSNIQAAGVKEILKKATKDRLLLSFVESVGFGVRPLSDALDRLSKLMSFTPGMRVLSVAWGLGEIKRLDYFYRKITVDFKMRKGHQFMFDAACETLVLAPEDHILVTAAADPNRVAAMIKDEPAEFVKAMLKSFGDMPITRLEEECVKNGFIKSANWKAFWDRARTDLKKDKLVEIPVRRTEPLHLKASAETYGDSWFTAFAQMTDPKSILSSVKELEGTGRLKALDEDSKAKISDRLEFALKGARGVDNALYTRIAFCADALKLEKPSVPKCRAYLWESNRYLAAARDLPARDTGNLVVFLTAENREQTKHQLFAAIPEMCFSLLLEMLNFFSNDADCEESVAALLKSPHPPATLVTAVLGRYDNFKKWSKIPSLIVILQHAIALGEGKQSGETLRMQNTIRRLFADKTWLEDIFGKLTPEERALLFERFQASTAWDPATHRTITIRMTKLDEGLVARMAKRTERKVEQRITSQRSYNEKKAAYEKLVTVDMPENTKRIEFARGYGDLSENAEYQYAKDEQRALLQKQSLMQKDLDEVKPTLFENVEADEVRPGTVAVVSVDGAERSYVILGEWDNEPSLNVISSKTKIAANLLGRKAGDAVELADTEGKAIAATVVRVETLSDELKTWIKG